MSRLLPTALLVAALVLGGCTDDGYVAPPPAQGSEVARPGLAGETVLGLQRAVVAGDPGAAGDLAADPAAADLLAAVVDNAEALRLTDVTLRYVSETGRTEGTAWEGLVAVSWRIAGYDERPARVEVPMLFSEDGGGIAEIGGPGHRLPLWLSGPLTVRRTPAAVVLGARGVDVASYARWARRASIEVRAALGGRERFVVEVPADAVAFHRALGATRDEYAGIAAVTAPVDGSLAPGSPVHVFVNPEIYAGLDQAAAQVVMTHEAVHAVTGAARARRAPKWLLEGFADYVALRDVDLPISRTAGQVIAQVRTDGLPQSLPVPAEFIASSHHLGAAYEAAWQVCVTLAEAGGPDDLIAFYRAVVAGGEVGPELRSRFGWSEGDLVAAWRSRLADIADVSE